QFADWRRLIFTRRPMSFFPSIRHRQFTVLGLLLFIQIILCGSEAKGQPFGAGVVGNAQKSSAKHGAGPTRPTYQEDIRPLLETKCFRCHSGKSRKKDLDLSEPSGILNGSESGTVIVRGKAEESLLYEKVKNGAMPPAKKNRLSEAEVETIRRWIAAGAKVRSGIGDTADHHEINQRNPAVTQADVIPILLRRCTVCHGLHRREAGLDLRTKASIVRGGNSGPAIMAGKPDESLVIKKIRTGRMPPRERLVEASVKPIEA